MKPHLYIIPFKDNQHLKVGISLNNNFNRINHLASIYDINHDNIIIYSSDNINNIKLLEKNIKTIINETITLDNIHYGKDGHTEIRNIKHLNDINTIIDTFKPLLKLYELKYTKQTTPIKKEKKVIKKTIIDNNTTLNNIYNTLYHIKQYITYTNINNGILKINLNLSTICNNDKELDNILNPLTQSLYINNTMFKINSGYTYDAEFKDIHIILYNGFRLKKKSLNKYDKKIQRNFNKVINNIQL
jgi:hypothetical protein